MDDLIDTIKAQLYDRITSPLAGSFIIAWCLWNWRFVAVVFSDMPVEEMFTFIDMHVYSTPSKMILFWIVGPLLTTCFYLFIYPHPARWVYEYTRKQHQKVKEIRQRMEDEEPLTKEQAREIRKVAIETRDYLESELEKESEKNKRLQAENEELKNLLQNKKEHDLVDTKSNIKKVIEGKNSFDTAKRNFTINLQDAHTQSVILKLLSNLKQNPLVNKENFIKYIAIQLDIDPLEIAFFVDLLLKFGFLNLDEGNLSLSVTGENLLSEENFKELQLALNSK